MKSDGGRRVAAAATGAILGGLIALGVDQLGITAVLKLDVSLVPIMAALGALFGLTRFRATLWVVGGLVMLSLLLVSYTPVASILARSLVRRDPIPTGTLDAVVALSGGITADNMMGTSTLDRLLKAAELAREGKAKVIVLSRESLLRRGRSISDSSDQANILRLTGVSIPILYIDSAVSTRDEALRVQRLPIGKGWAHIGLVTSPLHTRRACATFERVGFRVTCFPSESRDGPLRNLDGAEDRLRAFQGWMYEYAGTIKYRLSGWIP